jgi:predicted nucleic acid-binding protein
VEPPDVVLLDSGPLGLVSHPNAEKINAAAVEWLEALLSAGISVLVAEIADYEVRRELLRAGRQRGVRRLDELKEAIGYRPITTRAMLIAAGLWAEARKQGQPTAPDPALDADVILAAQARDIESEGQRVIVSTTNPHHLSRFVEAKAWHEIEP